MDLCSEVSCYRDRDRRDRDLFPRKTSLDRSADRHRIIYHLQVDLETHLGVHRLGRSAVILEKNERGAMVYFGHPLILTFIISLNVSFTKIMIE